MSRARSCAHNDEHGDRNRNKKNLHRVKGPRSMWNRKFNNGDGWPKPRKVEFWGAGQASFSQAFDQDSEKRLSPSRSVWTVQWNLSVIKLECVEIPGTKFCCGSVEILEGSTPSESESGDCNLTTELITMLSDDLFNCCCCSKVYSNVKMYK